MDEQKAEMDNGVSLDEIARREGGWLAAAGRWSWRFLLLSAVAFIGWVGWANEKPARLPDEITAQAANSENQPGPDDSDHSGSQGQPRKFFLHRFESQPVGTAPPSLLTVTPATAPKTALVKIGAWEEDAQPLPALKIELAPVTPLQPIGQFMVVVATVTGENGAPLADQPVEWSLDRQGIGDLLAAGGSLAKEHPPSRLAPFFARCHTARESYRLDEKLKLSEPLEIQPGQAWCIIVGRSPGDMVLTASCPTIAEIVHRQVDARIHWHDAVAKFPTNVVARAGSSVVLPVEITDSKGEPQSGYRTRFELVEPGGAQFQSLPAAEVTSNTAGVAAATLSHSADQAGKSIVEIKVFGGQAFPGKAIAIAQSKVEVEWQQSPVLVQVEAPSQLPTGQWTPVRFTARSEGELPERVQVVAVFDPAVEVSLAAPSQGRISNYEPPPPILLPLGPTNKEEAEEPTEKRPAAESLPLPPKVTAPKEPEPKEPAPEKKPQPEKPETEAPPARPLTIDPPPPVKEKPQQKSVPQVEAVEKRSPANSTETSGAYFADHNQVVLGTLQSGNELSATLAFKADLPATRWVRLEVRHGEKVLASKQISVDIMAPALVVEKKAPARWRIERPETYTVTIRNTGPVTVHDIRLQDELLPGMQVVKTDGLRFANHLLWKIPNLEPGEERTFDVTVCPKQLVDALAVRTWASAPRADTAETITQAVVTGLAQVSLSVHDLADPVEVGKQVEYLIEVENRGNGPAYGVRFQVSSPSNLEFRSAEGSLRTDIREGKLEVLPLPELPPGGRLYTRVRAQTTDKGEARLSITVHHDAGGNLAIVSQESTNIFQPRMPVLQFSSNPPIMQE